MQPGPQIKLHTNHTMDSSDVNRWYPARKQIYDVSFARMWQLWIGLDREEEAVQWDTTQSFFPLLLALISGFGEGYVSLFTAGPLQLRLSCLVPFTHTQLLRQSQRINSTASEQKLFIDVNDTFHNVRLVPVAHYGYQTEC